MKISDMEIERVATEWKQAFKSAHGKLPPRIVWQSGWFRIQRPQGWSQRYRRTQIEAMTKTLRKGFTQS